MNIATEKTKKYKPYPEYKDSGIDWLGEIPEQWKVHKLKHIATVRPSNVDKKTVEGEHPVKLCNYTDVYYNERITCEIDFMNATASQDEILRFTLEQGDVLITKDSEAWDDIAVSAYVADTLKNTLCGYHLAHIRPDAILLDGNYLCRAFSSFAIRDQFRVAANGITRFGLSVNSICSSVFPVPSLPEQRTIADFLDRRTGKIDELIAKKERVIELLREKRTALISHAVTKGLNPDAKMKDSGIHWLGEIPEHWEVVPLRWYISIGSGDYLPNTCFSLESSDELSCPVIGGNGLMGYTDQLNSNEPTIVIGRVGALCGNVHQIDEPAWITDNALRISNIRNFNHDYLALQLRTMNLNRWSNTNAQPLITGRLVKEQRVALLSVNEQQQIADFLDRETSWIDALIAKVTEALEKLKEYRTALISAAVTGKIDVRKELDT